MRARRTIVTGGNPVFGSRNPKADSNSLLLPLLLDLWRSYIYRVELFILALLGSSSGSRPSLSPSFKLSAASRLSIPLPVAPPSLLNRATNTSCRLRRVQHQVLLRWQLTPPLTNTTAPLPIHLHCRPFPHLILIPSQVLRSLETPLTQAVRVHHTEAPT